MKTELQGILDDPNRNGIHALPQGESIFPVLDGRTLTNKKSLMRALGEALSFPDYFGGNWDALEECLSDCSWLDGAITIHVIHSDSMAPDLLEPLCEVFLSAADYWREQGRGCDLFLSTAEEAHSR